MRETQRRQIPCPETGEICARQGECSNSKCKQREIDSGKEMRRAKVLETEHAARAQAPSRFIWRSRLKSEMRRIAKRALSQHFGRTPRLNEKVSYQGQSITFEEAINTFIKLHCADIEQFAGDNIAADGAFRGGKT